MAKPRPTITKRLREKAKLEKKMLKEARKADRRAEVDDDEELGLAPGEDKDIAHIKPGPQPLPDWMREDG
jgi:hypothetical protein